ncbi:MAG: type II secretion system protein GspG [Thermodesulfobacteriota bacterium]|nr:type II secretion system protein GspG [Thermodesulfobacteriota bacterium]
MIELLRRLLVAGIAVGAIAGNSDDIKKFFDDTVALTQQIATADDMRSMSIMLDYEFMRRGRYPKSENFERWMEKNFKENNLKPLTTDHWSNELIYTAARDQKSYILISCGPDGIKKTEDDIRITGP